jgi:hypothetical protein
MSIDSHTVQFYRDDIFLAQSIARFVTAGLEAHETVIIVVTAHHREELQRVLTPAQLTHHKLRFFDAEEQLAKFIVVEWPSELRFRQVIEEMLGQARQSGPVRIFGEMVAVLWAKGYTRAALHLEELWNKLVKEHSFELLCAYPLEKLSQGTDNDVRIISELHTHVHTQSV